MRNALFDVKTVWGRTSKILKSYWLDDCGATGIEYALIGAFISIAIITGASSVTDSVHDIFHDLAILLAGPEDDPFAGKL